MKLERAILFTLLAVATATISGCLAAPERCSGCLNAADGGWLVAANGGAGGEGGTGAAAGEGGGGDGDAGIIGSGGMPAASTGGTGTGGQGTGGQATGGSASGGIGTGGAGSATGGAPAGTGGRTGGATGGTVGAVDPDLVLWYTFDESAGTVAADSALFGGMARDATLKTMGTGGSAGFSPMKQVGTHSVSLVPAASSPNANGGYVTIPTLEALAPQAVTIAVWVNLTANTTAQNWSRIFDIGSGIGTSPNMYLTTRAADAANTPVRFAITNSGHTATAEQRLDGPSTLTPNTWHHIVVVLPAGASFTGTLYIDGAAVATNGAMTLHAQNLGATTNNWLGRS
ncbi:MAG: LamG domain-containing protein, partial [Polyangia bacterium]